MIASPYTWLEEPYTARRMDRRLFKKDGENYSTLDGLGKLLGKHFRLLGEPDTLPFVIRETRQKFQHSLSEVTLWKRLE